MLDEITIELVKLNKSILDYYGEKEGKKLFSFIVNATQLKLKTKIIIYDLDNLIELYTKHIFNLTEDFYSIKYKSELNENGKEILTVVNNINGNPNHKKSDEVTLLFYVGLYHKIENYENEILGFYNLLNETNFKTLKSIGLDIPNKKKLFADRDRIRIICNSIKHNNYYPKKELLKFYSYLSLDQKISLGDFNPGEDLELVKNYIKYFNFLVVFRSLIENEKSLSEFGFEFPTELKNYFEEFTKDETYKEDKFMLTYLKK